MKYIALSLLFIFSYLSITATEVKLQKGTQFKTSGVQAKEIIGESDGKIYAHYTQKKKNFILVFDSLQNMVLKKEILNNKKNKIHKILIKNRKLHVFYSISKEQKIFTKSYELSNLEVSASSELEDVVRGEKVKFFKTGQDSVLICGIKRQEAGLLLYYAYYHNNQLISYQKTDVKTKYDEHSELLISLHQQHLFLTIRKKSKSGKAFKYHHKIFRVDLEGTTIENYSFEGEFEDVWDLQFIPVNKDSYYLSYLSRRKDQWQSLHYAYIVKGRSAFDYSLVFTENNSNDFQSLTYRYAYNAKLSLRTLLGINNDLIVLLEDRYDVDKGTESTEELSEGKYHVRGNILIYRISEKGSLLNRQLIEKYQSSQHAKISEENLSYYMYINNGSIYLLYYRNPEAKGFVETSWNQSMRLMCKKINLGGSEEPVQLNEIKPGKAPLALSPTAYQCEDCIYILASSPTMGRLNKITFH